MYEWCLSEYMSEYPDDYNNAYWYPYRSENPYPAPCDNIKDLEYDKNNRNDIQYSEAYVVGVLSHRTGSLSGIRRAHTAVSNATCVI